MKLVTVLANCYISYGFRCSRVDITKSDGWVSWVTQMALQLSAALQPESIVQAHCGGGAPARRKGGVKKKINDNI